MQSRLGIAMMTGRFLRLLSYRGVGTGGTRARASPPLPAPAPVPPQYFEQTFGPTKSVPLQYLTTSYASDLIK